nr:MFS transporter [uncultured Lichenicoccus sp.]
MIIGIRLGYFLFAFAWESAAIPHAAAGSWQGLAACRGLLGFSEPAAIPTAVKMSSVWFPPGERAIATGWFNSGSSIGAMVAPPLRAAVCQPLGVRPGGVRGAGPGAGRAIRRYSGNDGVGAIRLRRPFVIEGVS